jgi:hypothetical protein
MSAAFVLGADTRAAASGGGVLYFPVFVENGASADPAVFSNNELYGGNGSIGDGGVPGYRSALHVDGGTTKLTSAAQINALSDMTVSGTAETLCTAAPTAL